MSGVLSMMLGIGGGFTPVTNTYTTGTGASETAPLGASQVVIEIWGAGQGGFADKAAIGSYNGASSGAYVKKTMAVTGGVTSFTYTVGVGGNGAGSNGNGTSGTGTTVVSPALSAGGGVGGSAAAATGGDVNTPGNYDISASDGPGLGAPNGGGNSPTQSVNGTASTGSTPGGGGSGNINTVGTCTGGHGGTGQIRFSYT